MDKLLEEAGGWSDASTSSDATVYQNGAASNFLEMTLWIEADRLAGLLDTFDKPKLDNQRDVVLNERRQGIENQPYGMSEILLQENLWPKDHGYHWSTIGYPADLKAATVPDVASFFKNYYVPNNATMVIEFEVLRTAFGDGFTSRLTQKLREEMGIVYNAGAAMDWRLSPGPFVLATAIQTPDTGRGLAEVIKILDDLSTNELTAAELEKSKQNIIRALPAMFDSNASTAAAFADLALQGLPDAYYATSADAVRRVTGKQVKEVARTVIPSGKMTFALVGDLAKLEADLAKLGLGDAAVHDAYGIAK